MKRCFLILSLSLLALVAGLTLYVEFGTTQVRRFDKKLADVVPAKLDGWRVEDLPLAATAGALAHVNGILQSDDTVQRVFSRGDTYVIMYAAYWKNKKMTTLDAGAHNPDSCWVNAGMKRTERLYSQSGDIGGVLLPFEYGVYVPPDGRPQHVMFWHLVQGEPQNYVEQKQGWRAGLRGRLDRLPLAIEDLRRHGLNQKREQLFVRISSNKSLEWLKWDPAFANLLRSVSALGIYKDSSWGSEAPGAHSKR